jgi:hypothetical protein
MVRFYPCADENRAAASFFGALLSETCCNVIWSTRDMPYVKTNVLCLTAAPDGRLLLAAGSTSKARYRDEGHRSHWLSWPGEVHAQQHLQHELLIKLFQLLAPIWP